MAERRRNRKRTDADGDGSSGEVIDKLEYEVAKYLRSKLPQKQTSFLGHKVDYFIANKAIDLLMESKWARADKRTDETKFPNRDTVVDFMNVMLQHKFFHRVKTIIVKKEIKKKQENESNDESLEGANKKSKAPAVDKSPEPKKAGKKEKKEKKEKKKVKFDMHPEQLFLDSNEPFVWIYDYIPMKTWLIGGGLVFAAIAVCLFPLWPRTVRNYVYYLSIAAAAFLFFIIALAVLKMVVFAIVWAVTFGRHHLWILPNLTEDVGFLESFWPLYKHEYNTKDSGSEPDNNDQEDEKGKKENEAEKEADQERESEAESVATTESGGKSTNGFEILDSADINEE